MDIINIIRYGYYTEYMPLSSTSSHSQLDLLFGSTGCSGRCQGGTCGTDWQETKGLRLSDGVWGTQKQGFYWVLQATIGKLAISKEVSKKLGYTKVGEVQ